MNRFYLDFRKIRFISQGGGIIAIILLVVLMTMCYLLCRNPYTSIHEQIFRTADNIHKYYSDRPGYWKLSTKSATDDLLVSEALLERDDFEIKIGIGVDGDMAMPSDNGFDIVLNHLNKSFCVALTEAPINNAGQLILQKITVISGQKTTEFTWGNKDYPLPVNKFSMRNICMPNENTVIWSFN